jgi:hypothetical protein
MIIKMKKGLSILLEQEGPEVLGRPPKNSGTSQQGGSEQGSVGSDNAPADNTSSPTPTQGPNFEETLNQRMSDMFNVFDVFDGNDTELVKKLSDSDMDAIKGNVIRRLKGEFGDNLSRMDLSILDDTFINYMVDYMVDNKKMEPFYIRYIPTKVYKITPRMVEAVGLMKVLVEQGLTTDRETLYINYKAGGGFEIIGGPGARNKASTNFKSQEGNDDIQARETGSNQRQTPQIQQQSQQTPEQPEKRPEEEVGLSGEQIQKKASVEGWAGIKNILSDSKYQGVKTAIENKMREDYVLTFPGDETIDSYEVVDLVKLNPTVFEGLGFTSLPMYRMKKRSGDKISQNLNNIIESGRVTKEFCKTATKSFYELATDDYAIDIDNLKATALYLDRCRDQHGGKWGIGDVEFVEGKLRRSGTDYRLDRMSSFSPEFRINWSDNTVSGQKFK